MILLIVLDRFRVALDRSGLVVLVVLWWSLNNRKCSVGIFSSKQEKLCRSKYDRRIFSSQAHRVRSAS